MKNQPGTMKNNENPPGTMKNHEKPTWSCTGWLQVISGDSKEEVIIFRDRTFLLYIDVIVEVTQAVGGRNKICATKYQLRMKYILRK